MAVQKGEGRNDVIYRNWSVTGRSDEFDAWLCMPDLDGRRSGVLLAHDLAGVTPALKEFAYAIARMGHAVVVPNLYYRSGLPIGTDTSGIDMATVDAGFGDARMLADLLDTAGFLGAVGEQIDDSRLGIMGIGRGGRLAMLLAARQPIRFRSVSVIDPVLAKVELPDGSVRSKVAIDEIASYPSAVQAMFPAQSDNNTEEDVERLATQLGPMGQVITYSDVGSDFWSEDSPSYDESAATDSLGRTVGFLDATLGNFTN